MQKKCAEALIKAGIKIGDTTNDHNITPFFIACSNQNYTLAKWLYSKEPKATSGLMEDEGYNILHVISTDFYLNDINMLPILLSHNKADLKKLSQSQDVSGMTPF